MHNLSRAILALGVAVWLNAPAGAASILDYTTACGGVTSPATCLFNAAIDDANTVAVPQGRRIAIPDGATWLIDAPLHNITAPNVVFYSLGAAELSITARGCVFTWLPPLQAIEGGGLDNLVIIYPANPVAGDKVICIRGGNHQTFSRLRVHHISTLADLGSADTVFWHVAFKDIEGQTFDGGNPVFRVYRGSELFLDHVWLFNQIPGQGQGVSGTDFVRFDGPIMDTAILSNVNVWGYDHCFMIDAAPGAQILDIWLNGFIADYCGFAGLELFAHGGSISGIHVTGQSWFTAYGNTSVQPIGAIFLEADAGGILNVTFDATVPQTKGRALFAIARTGGAIRDLSISAPSNFMDWGFSGAGTAAISLYSNAGGIFEGVSVGPGLNFRQGQIGVETNADGSSTLTGRIGVNRFTGVAAPLSLTGGAVAVEAGP